MFISFKAIAKVLERLLSLSNSYLTSGSVYNMVRSRSDYKDNASKKDLNGTPAHKSHYIHRSSDVSTPLRYMDNINVPM